ncbi:N-acetyltransferase [Streptomyces sp. NPDC026673]|uniref:GNAT family N-acetyltransferase n=1 Tax=Streptomyces sp. NPDC026673 TaxID=3155724 RepID=UPI0033C45068
MIPFVRARPRSEASRRHPAGVVELGPQDIDRAVAMHHRCSTHTLWSRYHRAMGDPRAYLGTLLARPGAVHLAVQRPEGDLVAVGHLMPDRENAEAALLVEDAWQNSGLGTRLLRHLGQRAVHAGWKEVYGLVLPGDRKISAILSHVSIPIHTVDEEGLTTVWAETADMAAAGLSLVTADADADA